IDRVDAIHEVSVIVVPPPGGGEGGNSQHAGHGTDAGNVRAGPLRRCSRRKLRQLEQSTSLERKVEDLALLDDLADRTGLRSHQRRGTPYLDPLGDLSKLENQVYP